MGQDELLHVNCVMEPQHAMFKSLMDCSGDPLQSQTRPISIGPILLKSIIYLFISFILLLAINGNEI